MAGPIQERNQGEIAVFKELFALICNLGGVDLAFATVLLLRPKKARAYTLNSGLGQT